MWPLQEDMDQFYGDPRGIKNPSVVNPIWLVDNLTWVVPAYIMYYDGKPVKRFQTHKKVAESLERVFKDVLNRAEGKSDTLTEWGANKFGGCYNYRLKRGGASLSCHAYGAAVDLDPSRNALHDTTPNFTVDHPVVQAFKAEGWIWGGEWAGASVDAMHFQAARVR